MLPLSDEQALPRALLLLRERGCAAALAYLDGLHDRHADDIERSDRVAPGVTFCFDTMAQWADYENSDPRADLEAVFARDLANPQMPEFLKNVVRDMRHRLLGPPTIETEGEQ